MNFFKKNKPTKTDGRQIKKKYFPKLTSILIPFLNLYK